jgi:peptidoglycan/LPS O-acetylase OafA/YrhL
VASTAFALTLILLHPWDHRTFAARALRPIALCGQMCYSLYLVHWPVTLVITTAFYNAGVRGFWPTLLVVAPLAIAASIAASWLFHLAVERRFLNSPISRTEPDRAGGPTVGTIGAGPMATVPAS